MRFWFAVCNHGTVPQKQYCDFQITLEISADPIGPNCSKIYWTLWLFWQSLLCIGCLIQIFFRDWLFKDKVWQILVAMFKQKGISITNFRTRNGRLAITVNYAFPVIRGMISHTEGELIKTVWVSKVPCTPGEKPFQSEWPVRHHHFRGVVPLKFGVNKFLIKAKLLDICTEIIFIYAPAQSCDYLVLPVYVICDDSHGFFQAPDDEDCSAGRRKLLDYFQLPCQNFAN